MAIDREKKREIIKNWGNAFPGLAMYDQNKLYKVVGPCILGIELVKSPFRESYSPYFVLYPIWKKDVKASLDYPIFLKYFKDQKGFQYDIPYEKHSILFREVISSIKRQKPLPFDSNIPLKKVLMSIDESSRTPPLSASPDSYLQAALLEAKLKVALFVSVIEAQTVLVQIKKRSWDMDHFRACGVDVGQWLQGLEKAIINRDEFLKQIDKNKKDKKIAMLESSELIG